MWRRDRKVSGRTISLPYFSLFCFSFFPYFFPPTIGYLFPSYFPLSILVREKLGVAGNYIFDVTQRDKNKE